MIKSSINLIPKKSDIQVKTETDVQFSSIYSAFLPILACLVWIGLVIANGSLDQNLKTVQYNIEEQKKEIANLNVYQRNNGQLVKKIEILQPIVNKDVDPNKIFEQVRKNLATYKEILSINGYTRASNGQFSFSGTSKSYLEVARVIKKFEENPDLIKVNLKSFNFDESKGVVNFTVNFYYRNLENQEDA